LVISAIFSISGFCIKKLIISMKEKMLIDFVGISGT